MYLVVPPQDDPEAGKLSGWASLWQSILPNSGHCHSNFNRAHPSRGGWPSPVSVVEVAGTPLVTFDAVEPFWTQASLTALTSKACFAEAWAAHVITFPSVDTLAGLSTANSVRANGTLILAPTKQGAGAEDRLGNAMYKYTVHSDRLCDL